MPFDADLEASDYTGLIAYVAEKIASEDEVLLAATCNAWGGGDGGSG